MKYLYSFVFVILFVDCGKNTEKQNLTLKEVAKEIIVNAKNCALITVDSSGVAHARTMDPFLPEEDFTIWFGTNPKSQKVRQIKQNPKVSLYYFDTKNTGYVTLQGNATIINNSKKKEKYWKQEWESFYQDKTTDYVLIKFIPKRATIISEKHKTLGDSISWKTPQINF